MIRDAQQALDSAIAFHRQGRLEQAEQLYKLLVAQEPNNALFHMHLGEVLRALGNLEAAAQHGQRATELAPNIPYFWFSFGVTRVTQRKWTDAVDCFKRVVQMQPDNPDVWPALASVYESAGHSGQVVAACEQALRITPNNPEVHYKLAYFQAWRGELASAIATMRRAVELKPNANWHGHLLYLLLFQPGDVMGVVFAEHLAWARQYAEPLTAQHAAPHTQTREAHRRLRIGYCSANFYQHAVSFFSEPMLAAHDREQFEIFCYGQGKVCDEVTERFKTYAQQWRETPRLSDDELAQIIRADQIDILVDLDGHVPGNRLLVFARKPAPVQVTYLGYQATTGMSAMDYRLTDAVADPPGADRYYTEKLVRLPLFFVYRPLSNLPDVNPLPALRNGFITFGSMNAIMKVNDDVIATWARLLERFPKSRLRVLVPNGERGNEHLRKRLTQFNVPADRLELVPTMRPHDYFELYHHIDIALDPFPFGGHTTTCDALSMGVPTVVLAGEHYVSRMGASVMTAIDHKQWLASSREEYIEKLTALASDVPALSNLRATLRAQLQASRLTDAQSFTRSLESAYRGMWIRYCEESK